MQLRAECLGEVFEYFPQRFVVGLIGVGGVFPFGGIAARALCAGDSKQASATRLDQLKRLDEVSRELMRKSLRLQIVLCIGVSLFSATTNVAR